VAVQWLPVKAMKSVKGTPEVAEAILARSIAKIEKLHFSPFKNPFNFFAPKTVQVSN
jgi:hypothetical protein